MSDSCRMRFIFYVKRVILGTGQRRSELPFIQAFRGSPTAAAAAVLLSTKSTVPL